MQKPNLDVDYNLLLWTHFSHMHIVLLIWKQKKKTKTKHIEWLFNHVITSQSVHNFGTPFVYFCIFLQLTYFAMCVFETR